ncbi:alpha-N-arabinofuranosidase [Asticcacaulis sp. AC402]|uniref:alpha-N-arabinofuranosidase n=1 Tax=Asticcacaulis sp. AC402 TaxID=1282361 RepID=UPI0003C3DF60|nr:alpha-N-arabinofuranosidase [Asticcacaulis sp. AC402]ESQ75673.1 alpha-L-arabinofuranosidase [Asticcacaulis sp. AC402]
MFAKSLLVAASVAAVMFAAPLAQADTVKATATLKSDAPGAVINKYVYGQFSEHLGAGIYGGTWVGEDSAIPNTRGIRNDIVAALKDLHVPLIRWPGGCFADEYHWRDGIGPRDKRPSRKNNWWGGTPETNHFGTHEFFDFAEQVGADAYVNINMGSGSPTEMREWIEYMTSPGQDTLAQERRSNGRDKPFKVPVIGLGNETWGCGGEMRPEYYSDLYRQYTPFFHKNADNPAARVAVGPAGDDVNWTEVVMKNIGPNRMEAIALHYYTLPTGDWGKKGASIKFTQQEWVDTFAQTMRMDGFIQKHIAIMDKYDPEKKVALYVDEWGTWYDVEPGTNPGHLYQLNTLRDGVLAAANFNIFHKYPDRVKMTAIAQTINVLQAVILTDGDKMALTPTYHAFKMYVPFQDATMIPLDVQAPAYTLGGKTIPSFNASAAKAKDGHVYIGIANMNPIDGLNLSIDLASLKAKGVSGQVLTAPKMDSLNRPGAKPEVVPVDYKGGKVKGSTLTLDIPAKSVVVVRLD